MLTPLLGIVGVTFSAPAAPAARLLPLFGKAAGVPMEADARLAPEVLLIRVANVPLNDVMARIAQATGGEWERKGEGYRLTLTGAADAKQRRIEALARGRRWISAAREFYARRAKGGVEDGTHGEVESVIGGLSAEALGDLDSESRLVFSTHPTAMQRALPATAFEGIDLSHLHPPFPPPPENLRLPKPGPAAEVLLILRVGSTGSDLEAKLVVADADGTVRGGLYGVIWDPEDGRGVKPSLPNPKSIVRATAEEKALASDLAATMPDINDARGASGNGDEIYPSVEYSEADLSRAPTAGRYPDLVDPVAHEPLALLAGPLLSHLAESQGANVVADLPDAAFPKAATLLAGGTMPAEEVARELARSGTETTYTSGWLVARPNRPAQARASRLNRVALGRALGTLSKNHALNLEEESTYVAAQPLVDPRQGIEGPLFAAFDPGLAKQMAGDYSTGGRDLRVLYHALGRDGARGQTFGALPPTAKTALERIVFEGERGPERRLSGTDEGSVVQEIGWESPYSLQLERTVYWGAGIPSGAVLTTTNLSEAAWFGLAPSGVRPWITSNAGGLGLRGRGNSFVTMSGLPKLERYTQGTLLKVRFELSDGPSTSLRRVLISGKVDPNAPSVPYVDLPRELREATETAEARRQKMIENWQRRHSSEKP